MPSVRHLQMESLESIIQQGKTGRIDRAEAELVCAAEGIQLTDMYNQVAVSVAKHFQSGTIPYEEGDSIMNAIFSMMTDDVTNGHPGPYVEPAWSIYLAFDEGEYDHGDGTDPIETITRPQIRRLLDDAEQALGADSP